MKTSRRMKRLSRTQPKLEKMNLTSLMDVFTILVFFLLVNSGSSELLEAPKQLILPESVVETKPNETVVVYIKTDEILVQGQPVVTIADLLDGDGGNVEPLMDRLAQLQDRVIGVNTQKVVDSQEVTILADKSIPFSIIKQVMSSCTSQGYQKISLAVIQKESQTSQI